MLQWVVLRTIPIHRAEFTVLHRLNQEEHPAMLPYETVWERKPGKRHPVERKYALFPTYVFAGLNDIASDYERLRDKIPEIKGILSRNRDWSPFVLPARDVEFIANRLKDSAKMTEVDLHKALKPGKIVEITIGGQIQTTKIDAVTKKGVKAMLQMFGGMHVVEVPFSSVRAA